MTNAEKVHPLDLLVYTRSFATLLGAGVSLQRTLDIMEEVSGEPLKSTTAQVREDILSEERGGPRIILSQTASKHPDIFTPMYVAMIRAGEVGGVLDETMAQVANALESDWTCCQETGSECGSLLVPSPPEAQTAFAGSPAEDQLRILSQYFRALATMLSAGVPLAQGPHNALTTAAEIFPPGPERDALAAIATEIEGRPVHAIIRHFDLPFVPPLALQLVAVGAETGTLHVMSEKIAQLLEYQRRYHLLKRAAGG